MPGPSYLERLAVLGGATGNPPLLPARAALAPRSPLPSTAITALLEVSVETPPTPQAAARPAGQASRVAPSAAPAPAPLRPTPRAALPVAEPDVYAIPTPDLLPAARPASHGRARPQPEPSPDPTSVVPASLAGLPRSSGVELEVPVADGAAPPPALPAASPARVQVTPPARSEPRPKPRPKVQPTARLEPSPAASPEPQSTVQREAQSLVRDEPPRVATAAAPPAIAPLGSAAPVHTGRPARPDRDMAPEALSPPAVPPGPARSARDDSAAEATGVRIGSLEVRIVSPPGPPTPPPAVSSSRPPPAPLARGFRSFGFAQA